MTQPAGSDGPDGRARPDGPEGPDGDLLVRPFLVTGGRTATDHHELRVETLVRAVGDHPPAALRFEARRIVELSRRPVSVAELAAALGLPIGVVRVLVGDLLGTGTVAVVEMQDISLALLERIRDRVRAL